jgi:hypothetical protein
MSQAPTQNTTSRRYTEQDIQNALELLEREPSTSVREAARRHSIPSATLRGRKIGRQPYTLAHAHQMKLTPAKERVLCDWLDFLVNTAGQTVSRRQIAEYATGLAGPTTEPGSFSRQWVKRFLERHPELRLDRASSEPDDESQHVEETRAESVS